MDRFWISLLTVVCASSLAMADTVWTGATAPGIARDNVRILRVQDGSLVFEFSGTERREELARVHRMMIVGEDAFNSAEEAYMTQKFDAAVDGYQKTVRATNKPFLKDWSTIRLIESANKASRFDAAVTAYISLLLKDPATATKFKPALPEAKSTYLDTAAKEIDQSLKQKLTEDQQVALLSFLIDVQRIRQDSSAEAKADEALFAILSKNPNNPDIAPAMARRKLQSAVRKLDARDFAGALAEIETNKKAFVDPVQQAEALYVISEVKFAKAQTSKAAEELQDAALSYMRIVANFKDVAGAPRVGYALFKTGEISELLGDKAAAVSLYQQVQQQYPDDAAAPKAAAALKKLQGAGNE